MTNYLKKLIASFVLGAVFITPALAGDYRVTADYGGSVADYYQKYTDLRDAGTRVVIDGLCISACTMVLGTLPEASVCATPFGRMGFHTASDVSMVGSTHSVTGTALLLSLYPQKVKDALIQNGWDTTDPTKPHPEVIFFPGTDFIKPCGPLNG